MRLPLWGHSEVVAGFVSDLTTGRGFDPCEAMGVIDGEGRLIGGLVFHNFSREYGTIEISAASVDRRWVTREVMREAAGYVLGQLGCQMAYARVAPGSRHIRRMLRACGGVEIEIPRMRGRDASEVLIVITEEAWRAGKFMEGSNATREQSEPDADGHGRRAAGSGRAGAEVPAHASTARAAHDAAAVS